MYIYICFIFYVYNILHYHVDEYHQDRREKFMHYEFFQNAGGVRFGHIHKIKTKLFISAHIVVDQTKCNLTLLDDKLLFVVRLMNKKKKITYIRIKH